jgi:hypothetical protein
MTNEIARAWPVVRRVTTFALGVAVIIDDLAQTHTDVAVLIVGLILVGVLPVEDLLDLLNRHRRQDDDHRP